MECYHYPGESICREALNVVTSFDAETAGHPSAIINEAEITHWSSNRVEAEYRNPWGNLTVRYWFDLEKQTATKAWSRDKGTEYWALIHNGSEEEQRSFDSTCRKLHRFLTQSHL